MDCPRVRLDGDRAAVEIAIWVRDVGICAVPAPPCPARTAWVVLPRKISHVFSDKTGTLTQNVMEFRKFSVGGVSYGRGVTDIGKAVAQELGEDIPKEDLVRFLLVMESCRVLSADPSWWFRAVVVMGSLCCLRFVSLFPHAVSLGRDVSACRSVGL